MGRATPHPPLRCTFSRRGRREPWGQPKLTEGGEAGLTLIEMIVALALGMLVVVFLAQGTGMLRHFTAIGRTFPVGDEVLAIRDHLRRQLEAMSPTTGPMKQSAFAGIGDTIVFSAPGDRLLETGGPTRITLAALPGDRGVSLVETRHAERDPDQGKGRNISLIEGAARIDFAYFGALSRGEPAGWLKEWTDPQISPSLIRIDVAFPPGDPRRWPPFIVYLATGGGGEAAPAKPDTTTAVGTPSK